MTTKPWNQWDAELLDTLQHQQIKKGQPLHIRTAETKHEFPQPNSRTMPKLICPYCGRKRCKEHDDLPALDPYFDG